MRTLNLMLVLFTVPLLVFGQAVVSGPIYTVTLSAPGLSIEIRRPELQKEFWFGDGPGNFVNGRPNWNAKSWIVNDWFHPVAEPDKSLRRVQAKFTRDRRGGSDTRPYVVFYVYDSGSKQGFVYLPGRGEPFYNENVNLLLRGDEYEGHWFHATPEWTKEAQALIEKAGR